MKIIAIFLSIILYFLIMLALASAIWIRPAEPTVFILITSTINYILAGTVAIFKAEQFYKWFMSQLK